MSRYCPKCGDGNQDNSNFCKKCGGDLRDSNDKSSDKFDDFFEEEFKSEKRKAAEKNFFLVLMSFIAFFIFLIVIFDFLSPLSAVNYENEMVKIDNKFRELLKEDSMYGNDSIKRPWYKEEPEFEQLLQKLHNIQNKGFPAKYKGFHQHYINAVEYYLYWHNTMNEKYGTKFNKEMDLLYGQFNILFEYYKLENKTN
jgi:zinc-ribbon domain